MDFILIKRLFTSELTWFLPQDAPQRANPRQQGVSLGRPQITRTLEPSRRQLIHISLRWFDGVRLIQRDVAIRRRKRTWCIEGPPLRSRRFRDLDEQCIVFIGGRRGSNGIGSEWTFELDVLHPDHAEYQPLYKACSNLLKGKETRLVRSRLMPAFVRLARQHLPVFGGGERTSATGEMSTTDREDAIEWLVTYLDGTSLKSLLDDPRSHRVDQILMLMTAEESVSSRLDDQELAQRIIDRLGTELLSDGERRELLARRRYPRRTKNYPRVGRWRRGSPSARAFVRELGLPSVFAGVRYDKAPDTEDVEAYPSPGPLHGYQKQLMEHMVATLQARDWKKRRAVVWLPTGTGKTRVMVETLLMHCRLEAPRNCILWVANRDELCEQAIEAFRQLWTVQGHLTPSADHSGIPTLRFIRLWGNRDWQDPPVFPTVIVASIQTLNSRMNNSEDYEELLAILNRRCAAMVFDEAHHVIARSYTRVMQALGLTRKRNFMDDNQRTAPPVFGLTATPARSSRDETERLATRFNGQLLEPAPPYHNMETFIRKGFLSKPVHTIINTGAKLNIRGQERTFWETFKTLPQGALGRLGNDPNRNAVILNDLRGRLGELSSVLVFACSVEHAQTLAEALSRCGHHATALFGHTPRPLRWQIIRQFRQGRIKVLVNCDLLTTGFDAPNVDAIVLARPIASRVLYAQIVGRGLRGPRNGGTEECLLLDYEDAAGPYSDLNRLRGEFRREFLGIEG